MTVTSVEKDPQTLTMTITAHFSAPVDRVWQVWADPRTLEFRDGFADESGAPNTELPTTTTRVALTEEPDGRTRLAIATAFPSAEAMAQLVAMGMEEGMQQAMGQIDGLLS